MFKTIYIYELIRLLRQGATYIYFFVFFFATLIILLGTGGYFDDVPLVSTKVRLLNSPYEINFFFQYFNTFFLFLLPAIIGMVIYRDFKSHVHSILYAFPIRKFDYLLGKFLSSLTVVFFLTFSIGIAFFLGELILGRDNPLIGPINFCGYASAYFIFVLPNMFIYGILVFVMVASFRNLYAGFIGIVLLLLLQFIINNLFAEDLFLYALLDPFGQNATVYETRLWTIEEQNERQIPVFGMVLWNRLFWTLISLVVFSLFYKKFQLEQETFRFVPDFVKMKKTSQREIDVAQQSISHQLEPNIDYAYIQQLKAIGILSAIDFKFIIKSWLFYIFVLLGMLALVVALSRVTNRGDLTFLPLTRIMLSVPMLFFSLVIMLVTFIYSGMLVYRSRMTKVNQLIDTTATSNWVLMGSKILTLIKVQALMLLLMMLCGIGLQVYNGYYHFEIGLYFFHLFIITFPALIVWSIISVFIHTILSNVYLGIFLLLLLWLGVDGLPQLGIESYLLRFNSPPHLIYSDMNGFGNGLLANLIVNSYWLAFAGIVLVLNYLFWERGYWYVVKERFYTAGQRFKGFTPYFSFFILVVFFFFGFIIYRQENSLLKSSENNEHLLDNFRTNFGKYKTIIQPKIISINLNMKLFPESHSFETDGVYLLVNTSSNNIDTLLIKTGYDEITEYTLDIPSRLIKKDEEMQFFVHVLEEPLLPDDSLHMYFKVKNKPNTMLYQNSNVLQNGTFLKTDILPRLGYFYDENFKNPTDSLAKYLNFYAPDADFVDFETIISTNQFQTAISTGALVNQWTKNGRNHFHFKTDEKVKFAFGFNSGVFSVDKTNYKGVALEIYHHEHHSYNLKDMTDGLIAALDYNTGYFGPYQHDEVRIVEFPYTKGSYATVLGNTIPTSEVRFVLNNKNVINQVNLPFYIQAHELTHQWWGNQLVPADALGAKMLTESITEYISLRIYDRCFGQSKSQHFLSLQRKRYLEGRTKESDRESPLYLVKPDQEYIAYGKGAIVFNTLMNHIGEDKLNEILKAFLEEYKFRTDQYPTSTDLIAHLKKFIPKEFHYIIIDMMESIISYDHKINAVNQLSSNKLEIDIDVKKFDHTMNKELEAQNIFLDIVQYGKNGQILGSEKHCVSSGNNKITISKVLGVKSIALDPHLNYIELDIQNNRKDLTN